MRLLLRFFLCSLALSSLTGGVGSFVLHEYDGGFADYDPPSGYPAVGERPAEDRDAGDASAAGDGRSFSLGEYGRTDVTRLHKMKRGGMAAVKRSPGCMNRCLRIQMLHPSQCHSLC